MYTSAKPYFYGTGRRKKSVARVRIYPGTGTITINKRDIDDYFGLETLKLIVNQPFAVTGTEGKLISSAPLPAEAFPVRPARSVTALPRHCFKRTKPTSLFSKKPDFSRATRE